MRLDSNGQCKDVTKIPDVVLTEKGVVPFRRNGPVDVTGNYGREDCVLVAINGACGYTLLTRDQLSAIQPLATVVFTDGGPTTLVVGVHGCSDPRKNEFYHEVDLTAPILRCADNRRCHHHHRIQTKFG
jgi:hypothetical protein